MIIVLTALLCEAKPIISHYKLKTRPNPAAGQPFPLYQNEEMLLAVTGIGKIASSAAAGFLGHLALPFSAWINIGIAGHPTLQIGASFLAHKIIDAATNKNYYPFAVPLNLPTCTLTTVDRPEKDYGKDTAYDMEASGFFPIASKFTTIELVHSYKVISDNKENAPVLHPEIGEKLIEAKLPEIIKILQILSSFSHEKNQQQEVPSDFHLFLKNIPFTVSQKNQLEQLIKKWKTLSPVPLYQEGFSSAKEALRFIENSINSHPLLF